MRLTVPYQPTSTHLLCLGTPNTRSALPLHGNPALYGAGSSKV